MRMAKELKDQTAHALLVLVVCGIPLWFQTIFACIAAGFLFGLVIEAKEYGSKFSIPALKSAIGSWPDLLGYSIGGLLLGIVMFS